MQAYIRGTGNISPQKTFSGNFFEEGVVQSNNNLLRCIEPVYADYLNPVMARRMGRVIKMGIASAMICLKDAQLEMPGAIITGTALGCLGDTEKFLSAMITDNEEYLTPTFFIQSIQNTVSAQIALHLKCTNHNFTFVHKGFSFESALLDSLLLLDENEAENILVGGVDEMTDHNFFIYNKLGIWKKEMIDSLQLFNAPTEGTIGGEGSTFFVLGKNPGPGDYAVLKAVKTIYNPSFTADIIKEIDKMLFDNNLTREQLDFVLYGINGDIRTDHWFNNIKDNHLKGIPSGAFKHLCGEYQTSGAFAMWLSSMMLKQQRVPDYVMIGNKKSERLSHMIIYNSYDNNHSLYLLSRR